ncbi:MAG TPA: squalene/phytoene synthase family protein [Devosiaceae bacterium]|nr:squalene/phytoene synthase family protein [Devosiaceae bacterium]
MAPNPGDRRIVADTLKTLDRERYYATLVLPGAARPHVQALYAYAAELATVASRISDPAAGEVRLQWWIDALEGAGHGDVRANPVAAALLDAVEALRLPVEPLVRMAEARRFDIYDAPMPNLTQLEGYAGETSAMAYHLAALIVNAGADPGSADAAGHLGVAEVLTRGLMALPHDLSRGRLRLPLSVFTASGSGEAELLAGSQTPGVRAAAAQLRQVARRHLAKSRAAVAGLPRAVRPVFAPAAVAEMHLDRLDAGAATPLSPVRPIANWRKIAALVGRSLSA